MQALFHVIAGVLIAGFLMPEGPVVVILGLAVVALMKAVYSYLDTGRLALTQVGYLGLLLAGGVLYMLYRLFF
ncbi:hypothetical protein [Pusillimonas sp. ANT_WB101]|uniref:hypothetical protein n=1 Tax=Pusillimonas sp. ANT_WB101 TaxID=2597356 RepID=UPI0011EF3220|nr:hypothetical protein [Pusillimonas sp. ANT_WB101]KAA0911322.1 hypothetical protein FQ179_05630 [Pusillimonas sp. ANT_WB101]